LIACSLSGCSGSSSPATGSLNLALTDSASDELDAFEVDVTGITFTKLNGSTVSVLAKSTRIDFTQLDSLSELISTRGLEVGFYSKITLSLDFSNALVFIKGQATAASVLDKNGQPITGTVDVEVDFAAGGEPQIVVNRKHLYELDLDLDSAVTVDSNTNSVTFCPVIVANADPANPKPLAVTGYVTSVDQADMTVMVEKRALDGTAIGSFTVQATPSTVCQVDGTVYNGTNGLAALAMLGMGTARVWVQGTLDTTSGDVDAVAIESGAGTLGNGQDWVDGHIVARSAQAGNDCTLTVLGRSFDVGTGTVRLNTSHTVNVKLGPTKVLRRGAGNGLTSDDLNVGQRIIAFGDLNGTTMDATGTAGGTGVVRMLPMAVFGIAAGAASNNTLTLNVVRFDLRQTNLFDFDVGGISEANPASYTVDVSGLSTTGIVNGSRIRSIGWCNPVGVALDKNFTAGSLVDRTNSGKVMLCQWVPPNTGALSAFAANQLTLDVSAATVKVVGDGFSPVTLNDVPAPTIKPLTVLGFYTIVQGGTLELHLGFTNFVNALQARIGAGASVFRISAAGTFVANTQAFSALATTVILN